MVQEAVEVEHRLHVHPTEGYIVEAPPPVGCAYLAADEGGVHLACAARQTQASPTWSTLAPPMRRFVYLDVGRWGEGGDGGTNYFFGLVCGGKVCLCEYRPGPVLAGGEHALDLPPLMETFLNDMGRRGHICHIHSFADGPPAVDAAYDTGTLYLILPDLHLVPESSFVCGPTIDGLQYCGPLPGTFDATSDTFGERAGPALASFIRTARNTSVQRSLRVVQVGDMYELWAGMGEWDTLFEIRNQGLVFKPGAIDRLKRRIQDIQAHNREVMEELYRTPNVRFIYGNHDVYLVRNIRQPVAIDPELARLERFMVLPSRRTLFFNYTSPMEERYHMDNQRDAWDQVLQNLRIPVSLTHLDNENSMFIEHGHRIDEYNQDPHWRGAFITEAVYHMPYLRALDPDRRNDFIRLAACEFHYRRTTNRFPPFTIFVMGHTHAHTLLTVNVIIDNAPGNSGSASRSAGP